MLTTIATPPILVIGDLSEHEDLLDNWREYQHFINFRSLKKQFRHHKPALIICCVGSEEDQQFCKQVIGYVRDGLSNMDTRIILLKQVQFEIDEANWMENLQVNCCLLAEKEKTEFNITALNRELETFLHIENSRRQHDAETDMLMCITQFSRENETLKELLKSFSSTLATLCFSECCFHIKIKDNNHGEVSYCDQNDNDFINQFTHILGLPSIPEYLQHILSEKHPQIDLLPDVIDLTPIEKQLSTHIGSYLTFPIVAYEKVLYLLFYLIPETHMDKVSMKQINVINKASEQLTMLLERRQAENSLKKQYQRLKNTLIELKSTKQELQHKEKMASIGQMAAGIAHEINNPLSYVISNFSSMDNYLKSIMQLQTLQSEFLDSIDNGQDNKIELLKRNISEFEEEKDIPFVLEDIRAVISDSFNGLQRVKHIITDLKSFTHSQSTKLEKCNLKEVIEDTLKILKYDLEEKITINKNLSELPEFMAHNGLMQQVLSNLIKNAIQAMDEAKTEQPSITINTEHREQSIYISVIDNGPGMPDSVSKKIFDPFFTTKTVGEGTGLGLSVTYNIIKKLGGTISVNSKLNTFTEFLISLPIKRQE
ncbi:MAG: sensor histidine kinase [Cellvibrionaceae bacterium]